MKKLLLLFFAVFATTVFVQAQNPEVYFASYPTLTPDGKTIIFSHEADLNGYKVKHKVREK